MLFDLKSVYIHLGQDSEVSLSIGSHTPNKFILHCGLKSVINVGKYSIHGSIWGYHSVGKKSMHFGIDYHPCCKPTGSVSHQWGGWDVLPPSPKKVPASMVANIRRHP